jgi:hypothetical protein
MQGFSMKPSHCFNQTTLYFCAQSIVMIITLIVDGKTVESRFVPSENLQINGYLQGLKNDMIEHNEDLIDLTKPAIKFVITDVPRLKKIVQN